MTPNIRPMCCTCDKPAPDNFNALPIPIQIDGSNPKPGQQMGRGLAILVTDPEAIHWWRLVEIEDLERGLKVRAWFCPDHFPKDESNMDAWLRAYSEAISRAVDRYLTGMRRAKKFRYN